MLIGISGGSGSGKSSFIKELRQYFTEEELALISEDNYYKEWHLQKLDEKGIINFDIPEAIDHDALIKDLTRLNKGEIIHRHEYTFNNDKQVSKEYFIKPAKVYIIEGLFIFHNKELFNKLDLKVLIHAKDELKIIRRIRRDQLERNYPIDDVLYRYEFHVAPSYEKYIKPYIEEMDLIINNNDHFKVAVDLFKCWIKSKLDDLS
ncbi:MAG: uridine kinase [Saprospiraceae bacterium]|nr:uridine kinase [Saprospiraceae bacterium]